MFTLSLLCHIPASSLAATLTKAFFGDVKSETVDLGHSKPYPKAETDRQGTGFSSESTDGQPCGISTHGLLLSLHLLHGYSATGRSLVWLAIPAHRRIVHVMWAHYLVVRIDSYILGYMGAIRNKIESR
jgi:hypothetical protein